MRKVLLQLGLMAVAVVLVSEAKAQCSLEAFPTDTVRITCGESRNIQLSAFGISGNFAINNNFNNNALGPGWDGTPAVTFTNPCVPSPDGTTHVWMGDATPQPRILTTQAFDLTTGGTVCYEMRYAVQSETAPCEGPDEPQEGVYLQYSINNGATWLTFDYLDPIGGYDPIITSWQQYCHALPVAAQTAATKIRWFQDATSGAEYDHWGLDNVFISINDPNYDYVWQHSGQTGPQPDVVTVTSDSVFTVLYTDGVDTCFSEVVVVADPPVFNLSSVSDTSFCESVGCIDLNAVAEILVRPASQPIFVNNEFQPLVPFGQPTDISVAVGGVPVETVVAGTLEAVCINVNNPFLFPLNLATVSIVLECPEGQTVTLVAQGSLTGSSLANMCFSSSGAPFSSGTPPYSGTFQPASGSMDDFIGCSTNGVWRMTIINNTIFVTGIFNSWGIGFNVPEISYQGIYEWSPTIGLSNPLSLNPQACPLQTTTYQLLVTDSFACATDTHSVTIGIIELGDLGVQASITDANCGQTDGAITLAVVGASSNAVVTWQDGTIGTTITALAQGSYAVNVEDGCAIDTIIQVGVIGGPQIDTVITVLPFPDMADGQVTLQASGDNPPLEYSLDGISFQSTGVFQGLSPGTYEAVVQDQFGCQDFVTVVLEEGGIIIPNVFGSGTKEADNQTFVIKGMNGPEVQIFSRWGRKVYESTAYQNDWNGEKCTEGVYFYTIKNKVDGQAYTGYVHLMR